MTKISSGRIFMQCGDCACWIRVQKNIGVCKDPRSDHYEHVLSKGHPACECLEMKLEEKGDN